jgi:nitroreductase
MEPSGGAVVPPVITDVDEVLTTTRTVRFRMDFERPVEREVIEECLEIAQQATVGSNQEHWRFIAVSAPETKHRIAELYRDVWVQTVEQPLREGDPATLARLDPEVRDGDDAQRRQARTLRGVKYLADHLERVPVLVFGCSVAPPPPTPLGKEASGYYGSIFPAIWSFQLALRSRGLGSVMATAAVFHAEAIAEILGLPEECALISMVPVAYTKGVDFRRGARQPLQRIVCWERWSL